MSPSPLEPDCTHQRLQRTGATRRAAPLVHHKDWQARTIEHFVSHPSEYPLVNLPEAKRAHDQADRIGRFGLGQQSNSNMLVPPSAGSSYLRWLFGLGDEILLLGIASLV